jgi:hypothetical protein
MMNARPAARNRSVRLDVSLAEVKKSWSAKSLDDFATEGSLSFFSKLGLDGNF